MSNSRLEKFIYAICGMEVDDLPTPLSRIETLWNCLITGETPDFEPLSRNEKYLMSMLTGDVDALPEPASRSEKLLYKIATGETDLSDVPGYLSRYEELLKHLIENGGIGGTDFEYVLYTLNDSFSTLYSTAEAPVKSAILKGNTLVNLATEFTVVFTGGNQWKHTTINQNLLSLNKKYIVFFHSSESYNGYIHFRDTNTNTYITTPTVGGFQKGYNYCILNHFAVDDLSQYAQIKITFHLNNGETVTPTLSNIVAMEYQEGMENWDIPYFTGMQSVKMPVLTTVGKNLFDGKERIWFIDDNGVIPENTSWRDWITDSYIQIKGDTPYFSNITTNKSFYFYDSNKSFISSKHNVATSSVTSPTNARYLLVKITSFKELGQNVAIYEGEYKQVDYEPFKSNILSCNEEVTLRGIGDVKDTLDGNSGVLTQRIGEIVLDGSEKWALQTASTDIRGNIYRLSITDIATTINNSHINCLCDMAMVGSWNNVLGNTMNKTFAILANQQLRVQFDGTLEELKLWLSETQPTIQYLKQEGYKTVGLSITDQDGQPTKLSTFNDITHVSIEAEDLLPTIDLEVATKIEETLSTLPTLMNDISETQQLLNKSIDDQAEDINEVSTAITEIHNDIL